MADFKQYGYIIIRSHEIEPAAFQFEQKDLTVDEQKMAILEYAHKRVIEETRIISTAADIPLPSWAQFEEPKPFLRERIDTGSAVLNTNAQPGGDQAGEPERASGRKTDTSARGGRVRKPSAP